MAASKTGQRKIPRSQEELASENPFSGRYEGQQGGFRLNMNIDMDTLRVHSKVLKIISGTVQQVSSSGLWKGSSTVAYFRTISETNNVAKKSSGEISISAQTIVVLSDGTSLGGKIEIGLTFPKSKRTWVADVVVTIMDQKRSFKGVVRTSLFFRDVKIDIDYTENLVWPVVELNQLMSHSDRKIDAFSAFEDAGVKLHYNEAESQKIKDPTPQSPWTRADMYEAMMHYFDETEDSDNNIWCMMGTTPPDRRYMGFSFDREGRRGFGLFIGHKAFAGYNSCNPKIRAVACRRLLHYFVHECGHVLGLPHPFEIGEPDSLSWMNYAWKYDDRHTPGSFYESFDYSFTDAELRAVRHFPDKTFSVVCSPKALSLAVDYGTVTDFPDEKLADDDSDDDEENVEGTGTAKKPMRKIALDIKLKNSKLSVGDALRFEARITNVGKLPVLIERGLSLEEGNLSLSVTRPDGSIESLKPPVSPILSGYTRPFVLYTDEVNEGQDRYSEIVTIGSASRGFAFGTPGNYYVRAMYRGGRYTVTSDTYRLKVTAPEAGDQDDDTKSQAAMALSLGGSGYKRFEKVRKYWQHLAAAAVDAKREKIAQFLALSESLVTSSSRQPDYSGKKGKRTKSGPPVLKSAAAAKTPQELLQDTADVLKYMQSDGKKSDNLDYIELVKTRGKLHLLVEQFEEADTEFNRLIADLLLRGVEHEVLEHLARQWRRIKEPKPVEVKYKPENLQKKFTKILKWYPTVEANGEPEISGVGLGRPFGNFLEEDIKKGLRVVELIFNKYYETKDLIAVLAYADKLQKAREVNYLVLHWALETFVVHCLDAKKAGLRYPEPDDMDKSLLTQAAMVQTARTGTPQEEWMNYWRCDADYNFHHRHWHLVYVVGRFVNGVNRASPVFSNAPPHLERQGELFGYMHSQMVARYDAERESWGLNTVQPWEYDGTATAFNAGLEFHSHPQYRLYSPRPTTTWPATTIQQFQRWEAAYQRSLTSGFVFGRVELTPNWAGHVLEPSSNLYGDIFGSIHNNGHGVFGSRGVPNTSYMNDTANAVRDTIFYRWHKRIDNLWQSNNEYYRSEISNDAPPVTLQVVIDTGASTPSGFESWNGDWSSPPPTDRKIIRTKLGPPIKQFEWDNKISHEPFYYHLRVKRNPTTNSSNELRLTIRIFIVPKNRETERTRFIEMDKFAVTLAAGTDHAVFTRADRHSSVIKRVPGDIENDFEGRFVTDSPGFCECGWPYHMLLPRGTRAGEEYALYAIATDNAIDTIGIRTTCGSMSFCGARGQPFPDSRNMGYPFSNPISVGGTTMAIPDAFDRITNGYKASFVIQNNVSEPPRMPAVDVWWPLVQLGLNDGTSRGTTPVTDYSRSGWTGRFRVLINRENVRSNTSQRIMVRFQGRGVGGGEYRMRDVRIAVRQGNSLGVSNGEPVLFKGSSSFTVSEEGIIADPTSFSLVPTGDNCFLTFTLDSPGVFARASTQSREVMTYRISNATSVGANDADWSSVSISNRSRNIYCVSGIMAETTA